MFWNLKFCFKVFLRYWGTFKFKITKFNIFKIDGHMYNSKGNIAKECNIWFEKKRLIKIPRGSIFEIGRHFRDRWQPSLIFWPNFHFLPQKPSQTLNFNLSKKPSKKNNRLTMLSKFKLQELEKQQQLSFQWKCTCCCCSFCKNRKTFCRTKRKARKQF